MDGPPLQPLTPLTMAILLALAKEDLHGYALMQEVEAQTDGALKPGTGSLYAALQRLEHDGFVARANPPAGEGEDERRRYFRITAAGRAAATAEAGRMMTVLEVARKKSLIPAVPSLRGIR